jgi:hypothetical protein
MVRQFLTTCSTLALAVIMTWPALAVEAAPSPAPFRLFLPAVARNVVGGGRASSPGVPALADFVASLQAGSADTVRGVYVWATLALPVVQQPGDDAGYVSEQPGVATQFGLAALYGVTGLLAHNNLAGQKFFDLGVGEEVLVVHGNGHAKAYRVTAIWRYQALQPDSPTSDFVDLASGQTLSAKDVFLRAYTGADQVTLQTCIAANGLSTWGRLFVIATPL